MNIENVSEMAVSPAQPVVPVVSKTVFLPAVAVMALGTALVLFTAFAPLSAVHNAAHDTRHAVVAPCH